MVVPLRTGFAIVRCDNKLYFPSPSTFLVNWLQTCRNCSSVNELLGFSNSSGLLSFIIFKSSFFFLILLIENADFFLGRSVDKSILAFVSIFLLGDV